MLLCTKLKFACDACVAGHRARDCYHLDRVGPDGSVYVIQDRGRPPKEEMAKEELKGRVLDSEPDYDKPQKEERLKLIRAEADPLRNRTCSVINDFCFKCAPKCCGRDQNLILVDDSIELVKVVDGNIVDDDLDSVIPRSSLRASTNYVKDAPIYNNITDKPLGPGGRQEDPSIEQKTTGINSGPTADPAIEDIKSNERYQFWLEYDHSRIVERDSDEQSSSSGTADSTFSQALVFDTHPLKSPSPEPLANTGVSVQQGRSSSFNSEVDGISLSSVFEKVDQTVLATDRMNVRAQMIQTKASTLHHTGITLKSPVEGKVRKPSISGDHKPHKRTKSSEPVESPDTAVLDAPHLQPDVAEQDQFESYAHEQLSTNAETVFQQPGCDDQPQNGLPSTVLNDNSLLDFTGATSDPLDVASRYDTIMEFNSDVDERNVETENNAFMTLFSFNDC